MTSLPQKPPNSQTTESEADFIPLSSPKARVENGTATTPPSRDLGSPNPEEPPLPVEEPPPLPDEPPPATTETTEDDGWEPVWDENAQAFYFYNRLTKVSQWDNPRVPQAKQQSPTDSGPPGTDVQPAKQSVVGGYNPAIHGDYDPNADYAKSSTNATVDEQHNPVAAQDPTESYAATGSFNRFTGKWQRADLNPDNFNDENKSMRQMNAFFDVDAAANSHDGRSLKAERSNKKLSKKELKAFKEKRRERKEEKRRAWLRD